RPCLRADCVARDLSVTPSRAYALARLRRLSRPNGRLFCARRTRGYGRRTSTGEDARIRPAYSGRRGCADTAGVRRRAVPAGEPYRGPPDRVDRRRALPAGAHSREVAGTLPGFLI